MATDSRSSVTGAISTDAAFRAWAKDFSDSLRAGGCTATADTGQINFTTVTKPAGATTYAGYEIYKLTTDTQDSNLGLRFKIEYGTGNTASVPAIAITVGTASDGAGAISGTVGTRRTFAANSSNTGGTTYTCAGDGRLVFAGQWNAGTATASNSWLFVIERLRDNTGAVTADGIYTFLTGPQSSAGVFSAYAEIIRSGSITLGQNSNRFGAWLNNATGNYLSDFYMATHHPADRNTLFNPVLSNLFYYHSDLTSGTDITVSRYGTNRNYKPIGRMPTGNYQNSNWNHDNGGIAILWE